MAVLKRLDRHADELAGFGFDLAPVVAKFVYCNITFGLESGIDHHEVVIDAYHFGGNHLTDTHFLAGEAFLK